MKEPYETLNFFKNGSALISESTDKKICCEYVSPDGIPCNRPSDSQPLSCLNSRIVTAVDITWSLVIFVLSQRLNS
jgi:hypothetical protein